MIIDAHSHLFQEVYNNKFIPKNLKEFMDLNLGVSIHINEGIPKKVSQLKNVNIDKLVSEMDKSEIKYIVTMTQDMSRSWNAWVGSNELSADLQKKSKGRLIGVAGFEPIDSYDQLNLDALNKLEFFVKKKGLKGLLFTPPYAHFFSNDRRTYPFYLKAFELDIPLFVHHGIQYVPPASYTPLEYGRIWLLDNVAIDFPKLFINVEHMAFPWTQELLAIMSHAPNIFTDISALFIRPTILAWNLVMAKEYGVINRVMYGTDYCGTNINDYLNQIKKEKKWCQKELNKILKKAGWPVLTEEEIEGILFNNALKFLKIE